ncbi:MAG: carboxypeptidase-like regulatory domain-containing protein [Bacteroidota bacterium]
MTIFISIFGVVTSFAQIGILTGTINDGEFNDILPFANVLVKGTTNGTTSDFDGKYTLDVEEGTYTIVFSYVGYQTTEITEVQIKSGQETVVDVTLNPAANQLEEVVVTTTVRKNTEASVLNLQKRSVTLMDGLSLQSIKRAGASNIASAIKTVPGVSVQGGKFVYVRGLGDRYTKTVLNGMDIPGLDPDRNTLQLDIFPTNILENIVVIKSASAANPADFTGGIVDIVTKDFPTKAEYSVSIGGTYNTTMHFNDNYLNYDQASTQWLGFDDGSRDLPIPRDEDIGSRFSNVGVIEEQTRRFTPQMAAQSAQSSPNFSVGFTAGNQYNFNSEGTKKIGFLASLGYTNTTEVYEDYIDGQSFRYNPDRSISDPLQEREQSGTSGSNNVLLTGLVGAAIKGERAKYKLNLMHIQNGESEASIFIQSNGGLGTVNRNKRDVLTYVERSISTAQLIGQHTNEDASWKIIWKLSPTLAKTFDKDFRVAPFLIDDDNGSFSISPSESGDPTRIWRELNEINLAGKVDFERKHQLFGRDSKFKFGGAYTFKNRKYDIDQYNLPTQPQNFSVEFNGDPDAILAPTNILNAGTGEGTYVARATGPTDRYDSDIVVGAAYVSEEFKVSERIDAILGLRMEQFDLYYNGENQNGTVFNDSLIIDKLDFFPSANLIFKVDEEGDKKLRASYSRTTARPSFKEASAIQIFDPISSTFFIGNLEIEPSYMNNFDLRYESYGEGTNFFAISGFYKTFKDPIELQFFERAPGQFTVQNLSDGIVFGAEIELRKSLDFIAGLKDWSFNTNISIIESQQKFGETELEFRTNNLRDGQSLGDSRQLQGQSPYLINAGLSYKGEDNGWQGGLFYNVQGRTLEIVGSGGIPDVYTLPFHNLRLNISKTFGENDSKKLSFGFSNLLFDLRESEFEFFGTGNELFSRRDPGQAISIGYSVNF